MPFRKRARITVTNEGKEGVDAFYFNIDYQALHHDLPADTMYFHAQYRQATPAKGWTNQWESNDAAAVNAKKNLDGENNYVWLEATGQGHFVGVTMSILQNQDGWWGEGDDMFFVDGRKTSFHQRHGIRGLFSRSLGLLAIHFPTVYSERRWWAPSLRAAVLRCTGFIWIRRSLLPSRSERPSSMAMPIIAPTIFFRSRTGTRRSRTQRFLLCRRWSSDFRVFIRWEVREMRLMNKLAAAFGWSFALGLMFLGNGVCGSDHPGRHHSDALYKSFSSQRNAGSRD